MLVTDLLHEKVHGAWIQKAGACKKVRLIPTEVARWMLQAHLKIELNERVRGMVTVVAVKEGPVPVQFS